MNVASVFEDGTWGASPCDVQPTVNTAALSCTGRTVLPYSRSHIALVPIWSSVYKNESAKTTVSANDVF